MIAYKSAFFASVSQMQFSCCIRLSWFHGKNWSMCPYIWTYLNPPMYPCLVALKLHLILALFALGLILRQWFDDNSKALLLLHKRMAAHCPRSKKLATPLARRWRQHSPSISTLNELADGDFSQKVPVICKPVLLQNIIQSHYLLISSCLSWLHGNLISHPVSRTFGTTR